MTGGGGAHRRARVPRGRADGRRARPCSAAGARPSTRSTISAGYLLPRKPSISGQLARQGVPVALGKAPGHDHSLAGVLRLEGEARLYGLGLCLGDETARVDDQHVRRPRPGCAFPPRLLQGGDHELGIHLVLGAPETFEVECAAGRGGMISRAGRSRGHTRPRSGPSSRQWCGWPPLPGLPARSPCPVCACGPPPRWTARS